MTNKFCGPCQAFLRGDRREIEIEGPDEYRFAHHDTAESFQCALKLPCAICVRLWAAIKRSDRYKKFILPVSPTTILKEPSQSSTACFEHEGELVGFHLTPWTKLPGHLVAPFSKNTGDDIALKFLSIQNQHCLQYHTNCPPQHQGCDFLPTRLIDVGDTADPSVRLREHILPIAGVRYAVLSHCWGNYQPATLTKLTADAFKSGVAITALPKTFQDAIVVTRRMQLKFIWIDSLCIIQDDNDDWSAESAAMRDVYSNAAFCIAATAAKDGNTGLFFDRDMGVMAPVKVELSKAIDARHVTSLDHLCGSYMLQFEKHDRSHMIDAAPLNDRAWVAQERFLSRRIIHFTHEILFWECQESFTSETHPNRHPDRCEAGFGARSLKIWAVEHAHRRFATGHDMTGRGIEVQEANQLYSRWCQFLKFYTGCKLTMGTDVLVALDGVSREIAAMLQDEMIAGLWKGRLLSELCWCSYGNWSHRPPFPSAPSWSWISTTTSIDTIYDTGSWPSLAEVQHAHVDLASSGAFARASLTLRCHPIPLSLKKGPAKSNLYGYDYVTKLSEYTVSIHLDRAVHPDGSILSEFEAFAVLLRYDSWYEAKGIVVVSCQDPPGGYKRIAFCQMDPDRGKDVSERPIPKVIKELAELQTIELF